MAAITDVPSILNDNNGNVRKWGTQLLAIADYSTAMPDPFFDTATNKPNQLPEGFKVMGYISTDGAKMSRGIEAADTSAVQDLEPVRSDITGRTRTMQLTFLEMNAWVKALAHGLPVSQWPENKDEGFEFTDEKTTEFPYYRLIWIGQDGVGDAAHYRIEAGYRVKVTNQGDNTKNRSDAEGEDQTFTFFQDPKTGKVFYEGEKIAKAGAAPHADVSQSQPVSDQAASSESQPVAD